MPDLLTDLDKSGSTCQWVRTWLGPTLGWVNLPVQPELLVTSAAAYTVPAYASRVVLSAAVKAVQLPDVVQWMKAQPPQANISSFDRSLWFKDLAYQATDASPITFTPFGAQTIDGFANYTFRLTGGTFRLYPMTDLSGWYVET